MVVNRVTHEVRVGSNWEGQAHVSSRLKAPGLSVERKEQGFQTLILIDQIIILYSHFNTPKILRDYNL